MRYGVGKTLSKDPVMYKHITCMHHFNFIYHTTSTKENVFKRMWSLDKKICNLQGKKSHANLLICKFAMDSATKWNFIADPLQNTNFLVVPSWLTRGGRKNKGPAFSAGQCPSLACRAEKKWTALLNDVVAFSYVISSSSSIFTCGIVCLKFFSLGNCQFFIFSNQMYLN